MTILQRRQYYHAKSHASRLLCYPDCSNLAFHKSACTISGCEASIECLFARLVGTYLQVMLAPQLLRDTKTSWTRLWKESNTTGGRRGCS